MTPPFCVCGHLPVDHDPDDGCGGCAMAMVGPCREFRSKRRADLLSGWWYLRPGETLDEHAARIKADPRFETLGEDL